MRWPTQLILAGANHASSHRHMRRGPSTNACEHDLSKGGLELRTWEAVGLEARVHRGETSGIGPRVQAQALAREEAQQRLRCHERAVLA
eukprot:scaffold266783_cov35-Tisochrysis_lutea.AAC.2